MNEVETIKVKLEKLKPFSGVLYDENDVATKIEGNPFYVPQDYLPAISAESEAGTEAATSADEGKTQEEKKQSKEVLIYISISDLIHHH